MEMKDHSCHDTEQVSIRGMEVVVFSNLFVAFYHTKERRLTGSCGGKKAPQSTSLSPSLPLVSHTCILVSLPREAPTLLIGQGIPNSSPQD